MRKRLEKAQSEIRPRSIPKSDWGLVRAWCAQCLVRACCGPGAGLVRAWQSWVGHRIVASILWAQDCFTNPVASRIAPVHYQQLWLGAVLARAQPCDGAGPAVELPGFRHVVDVTRKGRPLAKSASRSSEWKTRSCPRLLVP